MFNIKKIIIIVVVVILAFVAYSIFISGGEKSNANGVTRQAVGNTSTSQTATSGLDGPGKEFVTQLLAIQNIKFNLQLFTDPVFQGLQDWSREILPQESGRPNPFAPLEGDTLSQLSQPTSSGFAGDIGSTNQNTSGTSSINNNTSGGAGVSTRTNNTSAR